jgi:hypothetical protein
VAEITRTSSFREREDPSRSISPDSSTRSNFACRRMGTFPISSRKIVLAKANRLPCFKIGTCVRFEDSGKEDREQQENTKAAARHAGVVIFESSHHGYNDSSDSLTHSCAPQDANLCAGVAEAG